jgi:hypothetical protein
MYLETLNNLIMQYRRLATDPLKITTVKELVQVYGLGVEYKSKQYDYLYCMLDNDQILALAELLQIEHEVTGEGITSYIKRRIYDWYEYHYTNEEISADIDYANMRYSRSDPRK